LSIKEVLLSILMIMVYLQYILCNFILKTHNYSKKIEVNVIIIASNFIPWYIDLEFPCII